MSPYRLMPFMRQRAIVDEAALASRLVAPLHQSHAYVASVYKELVEAIPKQVDGSFNNAAALVAAYAVAHAPVPDYGGAVGLRAAYFTACQCVGWLRPQFEEWLASVDLDPELIDEFQVPNEPSVSAAANWHPGKLGRPPKGAWETWITKHYSDQAKANGQSQGR